MEINPSSFDGSEMMGLLMGRSTLLNESWEMCCRADQSGVPEVACRGEVAFVAFPRRGEVDPGGGIMVKLQDEDGPFSPLTCYVGVDQEDDSHVIKVHGEYRRIFLEELPEFKEKAILQESWGGCFCHVVSKFDSIPRLGLSQMNSDGSSEQLLTPDCKQELEGMPQTVLSHAEGTADAEGRKHLMFWPFGSYLFCSKNGAIYMDNDSCIVEMMRLILQAGSPADGIQDHLNYGEIASTCYAQSLGIRNSDEDGLSESTYESSISFALQSIGISTQDEPARTCLNEARQKGIAPVLRAAELAVKLGKIHPRMAQIEWYKKRCEEEDEKGYYDVFKEGRTRRRESEVNMNLIYLGQFWDKVITMVERNELPQDFTRRSKWMYAPHTYMLLAEPLEIAQYYRTRNGPNEGHYISAREKRFRVFDKWWQRNTAGAKPRERSRHASLTQDPVFWARVEEAREQLNDARQEMDPGRLRQLVEMLRGFEDYAVGLNERMDVSPDVLFLESTYTQWAADWNASKSHFQESLGMTI